MKQSTSGLGLGLEWILFIVFLILKLTDVIDWSWWWVTAPLWIPLGITVIGVVIAAVIIGTALIPAMARNMARKKGWWKG